MANEQTSELVSEQLFTTAIPNVVNALLPFQWLWRWSKRNYGTEEQAEPLATLLTEGLLYGEAPRFRLSERRLYYVDSYANAVRCYDPETKTDDVVFEHDDYVSGLGWLPDGRMLIVSMNKQQVVVYDQLTKAVSVYADLTGVVRNRANDMVVSSAGHAYIGNFGFDLSSLSTCTTTLVRVDPTAQCVHVEATGLFFPNGSVITPDGKTLIVAETYGGKLTAFTIGENGALLNRRVWANLQVPVDGMCLDADGCVWVAVPQVGLYKTSGALLRVRDGGEIVAILGFGANGISRSVFACQLGTDADGSHFLYFLEAMTSDDTAVLKHGREEGMKNGVLKRIQVDVGPATMADNANYCGGYC